MHSAAMRAAIRDKGESRLTIGWAQVRKYQSSAKFVRLAELRKLRECEQVAAVCYRVRGGEIEFLLVKTGKGRWIFPKGSVEPGLTHAQAAALEAFEEAGVHGRMEEASFTRYIRRRRRESRNAAGKSAEKESAVNAHLCEVLRLVPPQELGRNPTWFSPEKAKRRLQENRTPDFGGELARVVDRAVSRIRRSRSVIARAVRDLPPQVRGLENSGLQKVQFIDIGRVRETAGRNKAPQTG
jgi:8-oxo-dGTP pyrophosphatase MutT (NUDIX family)